MRSNPSIDKSPAAIASNAAVSVSRGASLASRLTICICEPSASYTPRSFSAVPAWWQSPSVLTISDLRHGGHLREHGRALRAHQIPALNAFLTRRILTINRNTLIRVSALLQTFEK